MSISTVGFYWVTKTGADLWALQILGTAPFLHYIAWQTGTTNILTGSNPAPDGFGLIGPLTGPPPLTWDSSTNTWDSSLWA